MRNRIWLAVSLGIGLALAPTGAASAQLDGTAEDGGGAGDGGLCRGAQAKAAPVAVFPALGSDGVARDALVRAVFAPDFLDGVSAAGGDVRISLSRCDDDDCEATTPVAGHAVVLLDSLVFDADRDLEASTAYVGEASGEDGALQFGFRTGDRRDSAPPVLGRNTSIDSGAFRGACDGEAGVRVEVTTDPAADDGPHADMEYLLYMTRGPTVTAPVLVSRRRAEAGGFPVSLAVVLDDAQAASPVCFALQVVDGAGRLGAEGDLLCIDPRERGAFAGICAVAGSPARPGGGGFVIAWCALALAILARRRHHLGRS